MDILSIFRSFKTQEQCLAYLEEVRWRGEPACMYCGSLKVCRHASGDRANQRWQCQDCHKAFSVTVGTIFHRTHMPLQTWFMVLALMLNAKKSASRVPDRQRRRCASGDGVEHDAPGQGCHGWGPKPEASSLWNRGGG